MPSFAGPAVNAKRPVFEAINVTQATEGRKLARVTEALCTGCGVCNVACPTGAASLSHFKDAQINKMIED
jgi:heterodisulfide reductase subunit A